MAKKKPSRKLAQGNDLNGILFEPLSTWEAREHFPDLSDTKIISIDCETRDPNLSERGPGSLRKDGYPVGFSIATDTGFSAYYPIAHLAGGNLDKDAVLAYLRDTLKNPHQEKVGASFIYDLEWLESEKIRVSGRLHDVQLAEALIDEESETGYSLDALGLKYLGKGKDEVALQEAARAFHINAKGEMWKLHSKFVGPYATMDAVRTLEVRTEQKKELERQQLEQVYNMECELLPIVLQMRLRGVRVDLETASKIIKDWKDQEDSILYKVLMEYGIHLNPWSQKDISRICDRLKLQYPRTAAGNASFDQDFLDHSSHPFFKQVRDIRRLNRMGDVYVKELIFGNEINGRIHCQFHQLKGDEYGVRGGRFSCSNPNLQQTPSGERDPILAAQIRSLFLPEIGADWAKLDYAQQEPRITVHYAYLCKLIGAEAARQAYLDNPLMDYYKYTGEISNLPRRDSKTVTLGRAYGMGKHKLANDLGRPLSEAEGIISKFDAHNPYIKALADKCMVQVETRGYIKTIGGRKCHFNKWIPAESRFDRESGIIPIEGLERAQTHFPGKRLIRAFTHKSLNRLIQGSAGDMTKLSIIKNYKEGGDIPHITMHDENDYSVSDAQHAARLKSGMENCVEMTVPIIAELTYGKTWK